MIETFNRRLAIAFEAMAAVGCAVLAILVTTTIFMRFVMGASPYWGEELPQLVLVWSAFLGSVVCSYRRTQLSAGLLPLMVHSTRYRGYVDRFANLLLLVIFVLLARAGWGLAQVTMEQTTTALQIPAAVLYLSVPVGCVALIMIHLGQLLEAKETK